MFSPPLSSLLRLLIRELQIWGCGRPQVQDFTESFSHIIVEKYSTWKALLKNFSLVVIFMLNITPSKVSMHLRQQVATTCHGNTSQQQITSCVLDNFCESLSLKQSFVGATSCTNSVSFDFLRLVAATKFCSRDKDFHKNLDFSTHEMICRGNVLLQLFAGPVHKEWFVMATFCWNLSPSVFEPLVTTWHKPRKVKK